MWNIQKENSSRKISDINTVRICHNLNKVFIIVSSYQLLFGEKNVYIFVTTKKEISQSCNSLNLGKYSVHFNEINIIYVITYISNIYKLYVT